MQIINKLALFGAIFLSAAASAAVPAATFSEQLEMLEWADPERAAQIIDAAPPLSPESREAEINLLEIRAMIYADGTRDEDVLAVERRLEAIAGTGDDLAVRAGRFVRAYSAREHSQFAAAEAELKAIDMNSIRSDAERYRVVTLRGNVLRVLGQDEAALPFLEQALDLANKMHDSVRTLHALLSLVRIYTDSAGDAVLAAMAQRLSGALREDDKLVRWGGEEFLAVLGPMTPLQADLTADRLLQAVRREPVLWNGHLIHCTISIGYASFPLQGSAADISLDSAISLVDKALYEAKRRGRDRACLIKVLSARDEKELTRISSEFESATSDRRVLLVEILGAAA